MSKVSNVLDKKSGEVLSVTPDTPVYDAIKQMAAISAGTALVIDGDKLVGIISERDFIRKVYLEGKSGIDLAVAEIMSAELLTVTPSDCLENCMNIMTSSRIRHLPVLEDEKVVGVISIGDIVKNLAEAKEQEIKNLQSYLST